MGEAVEALWQREGAVGALEHVARTKALAARREVHAPGLRTRARRRRVGRRELRIIRARVGRAVVRGADPQWIRRLYDIALVPDATFYLRIRSARELVQRVLASGRGFDYWESGMDLRVGEDLYDSFVTYQSRLLKEFDRMTTEYGFHVISASRSVKRVAADLRRAVARVIDGEVTVPDELGATELAQDAAGD